MPASRTRPFEEELSIGKVVKDEGAIEERTLDHGLPPRALGAIG